MGVLKVTYIKGELTFHVEKLKLIDIEQNVPIMEITELSWRNNERVK